jgi:hypothetical protein
VVDLLSRVSGGGRQGEGASGRRLRRGAELLQDDVGDEQEGEKERDRHDEGLDGCLPLLFLREHIGPVPVPHGLERSESSGATEHQDHVGPVVIRGDEPVCQRIGDRREAVVERTGEGHRTHEERGGFDAERERQRPEPLNPLREPVDDGVVLDPRNDEVDEIADNRQIHGAHFTFLLEEIPP